MTESGSSSTSAIRTIKPWDGDRSTFDGKSEELADVLVLLGAAYVGDLNLLAMVEPTTSAAKTRQNAISWVAITTFVGPLKRNIIALYDQWAAANNELPVVAADGDVPDGGYKRDSKRLWAAVVLYSKGALPDVAGPEFQAEVEAVKFAATGTYTDRTSAVLDQLELLRALAVRLNDDDYPFSEALACSKFRSVMPARFHQDYVTYEGIKVLAVLRARAMRDARRYDASPDPHAAVLAAVSSSTGADATTGDPVAAAVTAMATRLAGANLDPVVLAGILSDVAANATEKHGNRRSGGGRRRDGGRPPRNMNRSKPVDGKFFCDEHGWCAHRTSTCKKLNGETAPGGPGRTESQPAEQTLYRANGDGTFSKLSSADVSKLNLFAGATTTVHRYHVDTQTGQLAQRARPLTEADIDAIVAATGVDIGDMWIIDTGAEISMAKGANASNTDASLIADSIIIDGSNPGPKSAITHEMSVDHDCGTMKFGHLAVGPSKYNIVSTNDMGTAGISVLLSAADPQCQTMLLFCASDPSGNSTVAAVRVGGLWAVPRTDLPGAAARARCAQRDGHSDNMAIAAIAASRAAGVPTTAFATTGVASASLPPGAIITASRAAGVPTTAVATAGVASASLPPGAIIAVNNNATSAGVQSVELGEEFLDVFALRAEANNIELGAIYDPEVPASLRLAASEIEQAYANAQGRNVLPTGAVVLAGAAGPGITVASDELQAAAAAAVNPVTSPSTCDYADFRRKFGKGSHRHTMERARELGIKLTGATPEVRDRLNIVQRTANARQQATRAINVHGSNKNLSISDMAMAEPLMLSGDTIGNRLPTSKAGNASAQVWVRIGDPQGSYFVTVGKDHTAATTADAFQKFCKYRGFPVLREAISQPVQFASDGGSEYKAEFAQMLQRAGIPHEIAVAYKHASGKQALAESAAALAQQAMRRDNLEAAARFSAIGHDADDYWDYSIVYASKRATQAGRRENGDITQETLDNLVPAPYGAYCTVDLPASHPDNAGVPKQCKVRGPAAVFLGTDGSKRIALMRSGTIFRTTGVTFTGKTMPTEAVSTDVTDIAMPELELDDDDVPNGGAQAANALVRGVADVGDHVQVFWPAEDATYQGNITNIDPSSAWHPNGSFTVHYEDNDIRVHALDDADALQVAVLAASRGRGPHASIAQYVGRDGNILPGLLDGTTRFNPPPFPVIRQDNAPAVARGLQNALADELAPHYLAAILAEYHGHANPPAREPTFQLIESELGPNGERPDTMHEVWVFRFKFVAGLAVKLKARCAADGSSGIRGVTFHESYVGTAPISDVRRMEVRALLCDWDTSEYDLVQAYCQHRKSPRPDGKSSLVTPAHGNQVIGDNGYPKLKELHMALYGEGGAGDTHVVETTDSLLGRNQPPAVPMCPLPIHRCPFQPTLFKVDFDATDFGNHHMVLYLHNDNLRVWSSCPAATAVLHQWLMERWEITGSPQALQTLPPTELLGMTTTYGTTPLGNNWFSFSMKGFIMAALTEFNALPGQCKPTDLPMVPGFTLSKADYPVSPTDRREVRDKAGKWFKVVLNDDQQCCNFYAKVVSTIGWIVKCVAPIIALAFSVLGRAMACPCTAAFKACRQLLRYLSIRTDIELYYERDRVYDWEHGDWPEYLMTCDAGMFGDADGRSQGGHEGHFRGQAADHAVSSRMSGVMTSTFMAEATQGTTAAKQGVYVFNVDNWLGVSKKAPIPLGIDNLATVLSAARPKFSPKSKHFNISARYLAEIVEQGIVYVYHVAGTVTTEHDGIASDALTKPLSASLIAHYYPILQGRRPTA